MYQTRRGCLLSVGETSEQLAQAGRTGARLVIAAAWAAATQ